MSDRRRKPLGEVEPVVPRRKFWFFGSSERSTKFSSFRSKNKIFRKFVAKFSSVAATIDVVKKIVKVVVLFGRSEAFQTLVRFSFLLPEEMFGSVEAFFEYLCLSQLDQSRQQRARKNNLP